MKILVFDTETTGLIPKDTSLYQTNSWPYVVQFSFILFNTITNKIELEQDYIIKIPKHVEISRESTKVHGITKQKTIKQGFDMKDVLEIFKIALESCDFLVAHNINFDKKLIMVENIRNKVDMSFNRNGLNIYCTMKNGINICNIEKKNENNEIYKKYPSLLELHYKLFNTIPCNLHNSLVDVLICMRCFYKIIFNEDLCKKNKQFKKYIVNFIESS